jgi:UDP-glucose 4-epimerase
VGKTFNIACGDRFTLNQLVDELRDLLKVDIEAEYAESRTGDVKHSLADIQKARDELGYEPAIGFREGLERTVASFGA